MATDQVRWQASTQYFLQESLGEGMSSQVFRAERSLTKLGLKQTVAIKVLKSKNAVDMWRQEFESLARVKSPYCVRVFAFDEVESKPALVLEYVDGLNLRELLQYGHLSMEDCREILAQVQAGLRDLEQVGLSHGDLSPKNIMVDGRGQIHLLDFGLANYRSSEAFFTPGFAAPELLAGGQPNAKSDMFSLGALAAFLEKYTRTQKLLPEELLNSDPNLRNWSSLEPDPLRKERLGRKLAEAKEKRLALANLKTKTLPFQFAPVRRSIFKFQMLLVAAALIFTSDSSPALMGTSGLRIRTVAWHYIYIDGRPLGYAPLDLNRLAKGPHEILWRNAQTSGRLRIQLHDKETKTLTERDFQSY